jgi:hypothetical protein
MYRLAILFFSLLIFSCSNNKYWIPEDKMVQILTDYHLTEGVAWTNSREFSYDITQQATRDLVFEKYGITKEQFDTSLYYYSVHIEKFDRIYEKVLQQLIVVESRVKAGEFDRGNIFQTSLLLREKFPQDSTLIDSVYREIWWDKREFSMPAAGDKYRVDFELEVDTLIAKWLMLKADVILFYDDCSEKPRSTLRLHYQNDSVFEVSIPMIKDSVERTYTLQAQVCDTLRVVKISGAIINHDKCLEKKHAEVSNIRMYELLEPDDERLLLPATKLLPQK